MILVASLWATFGSVVAYARKFFKHCWMKSRFFSSNIENSSHKLTHNYVPSLFNVVHLMRYSRPPYMIVLKESLCGGWWVLGGIWMAIPSISQSSCSGFRHFKTVEVFCKGIRTASDSSCSYYFNSFTSTPVLSSQSLPGLFNYDWTFVSSMV